MMRDAIEEGMHQQVVDYMKDDLSTRRSRYDVVFEAVGKLSFKESVALVKNGGVIIRGSNMPAEMLKRAFSGKSGKRVAVVAGTTGQSATDMEHLAVFWGTHWIRPVIDSTFRLERIRDAHALEESWRKRGSVVVTMGE